MQNSIHTDVTVQHFLGPPSPPSESDTRAAASDHPDAEVKKKAGAAQHALTLSTLEIEVLAALWNNHPRPLRISEIYLAVRAASDDPLQPFVDSIDRLVGSNLVDHTGVPLFHYQLSQQGTFAAMYLAIAGVSDRFKIAQVVTDVDRLTAVAPAAATAHSFIAIEHCHCGCGQSATAHCECGNAVCATHRYSLDGERDPTGHCGTCHDEIVAEHCLSRE